jgi:BirA family transcriptional regulator, biotin operon repressor / biotin---[acetyl-CoA-carboxylase] ligase
VPGSPPESPFSDLDRPPLRERPLARALLTGGVWSELRVLARTGSTNVDVAAAARRGAPEGLILVAEEQTSGRGRLDRSWSVPPRAGLTFSVLLRPDRVPAVRWGWLPLLAGVAVCAALEGPTGLRPRLKWPNDVLLDGRKLAGILVEGGGDALVVGIGLNVSARAEELPVAGATSLALAGSAVTDRDPLLRMVLRELADRYQAWRGVGGDPEASGLRAAYRQRCDTVDRTVRVDLPGGQSVQGRATGVDAHGRLEVRGPEGTRVVAAGDVVHVR